MSQYAIGMVRMYYRDLDNPGRIVRQLRDMGIHNHDTRDVGPRAALETHTCGPAGISPERPRDRSDTIPSPDKRRHAPKHGLK